VATAISRVDFAQLVKAIWPFILVEMIVLALIIYIPGITMFVPRLLGFVQ